MEENQTRQDDGIDEPIVWIVDLCQEDDYRFRDAEYFQTAKEAEEYIEWLKQQSGPMVYFGGPYHVRESQILTVAQAKQRYLDSHNMDYQGE